MKFYDRIIDCEVMLEYLYSRTQEDIELETVLDSDNGSVSRMSLSNWKLLDKPMNKKRIQKLRDDRIVDIAEIEDVSKLWEIINNDTSLQNAKRVFNMLFFNHEESHGKLRLDITDENADTPLAVYMTKIIGVKLKERKYLSYLPGRSVTLKMLCDLARDLKYIKKYNYKKKGILNGLKSLVDLGLVKAFVVEKNDDNQYDTKEFCKGDIDITNADNVIFKLSISGCIKYTETSNLNCAKR